MDAPEFKMATTEHWVCFLFVFSMPKTTNKCATETMDPEKIFNIFPLIVKS